MTPSNPETHRGLNVAGLIENLIKQQDNRTAVTKASLEVKEKTDMGCQNLQNIDPITFPFLEKIDT